MSRIRGAFAPSALRPVVSAWIMTLVCVCGALSAPSFVSALQSSPPEKADKAAAKSDKDRPLPEDNEIKMGREAAEENDKQIKIVTDAAMVERVNRIGQEIAAVANKTPITATWGLPQVKQFNYSFKIVDDKDVNAYSLPGGFIYVNKGLLNYVHSDDELAGVLAHEIGHAAHHHMMRLLKEQSKLDRVLLPLKLLTLAALVFAKGSATDAQNLMLGTQLYAIAKLNGYGVEAEKDADQTGIRLLTHTKYNPVGLYSFMLRNAVDEQKHGPTDLGIFRTHPPGEQRATAAKALLDELHIPIRLSEVDPKLRATITLTKNGMGGTELAEIRMRDIVLCRIASADGQTAEQRALRVAQRLTDLMDSRLQPFEVRLNSGQTKVIARNFPVLDQADATAQQKTLSALAREMSEAVSQCLLKQQIESGI